LILQKDFMNKDMMNEMKLKVEDTVVVNVVDNDLMIVSFLESIYGDDENTAQAQAGVDKCFSTIEDNHLESPVNVIVDLRPMGNKSHISPDSREIYINFVADPRIARVAVLGSSDAQTSIANFILSFDSRLKDKLAWFSEETEAKYWLSK